MYANGTFGPETGTQGECCVKMKAGVAPVMQPQVWNAVERQRPVAGPLIATAQGIAHSLP